MRRGFKAWCERTSADYRNDLGVPLEARLEPRRLAERLGVQVVVPEDIPTLSAGALRQLTVEDAGSWSAVTLGHGSRPLIVLNSAQSLARQANSLAHELAHLILNHRMDQTVLSAEGFLLRETWNKEQEEEAAWLGATLLVPRAGLLTAYRAKRGLQSLAEHFGVSQDLIRWRLSTTGVRRQTSRRRMRFTS